MAVNIGPKIGIDGEAEYRKQIQRIIQETKTLDSQMKSLKSSFDKEGASIKQNREYRNLLTEKIEAQKQKVTELNSMLEQSTQKYGENDTKTLKWKQAVEDATAELNEMNKELKDTPTSLQMVGDKMQEVGDKMSKVGDTLTKRLTLPIVGVATAAVKVTADFDAEMSKVRAISGSTSDEFDALREKAREMGAQTKFSASEAAEAMEYMAMAGWKTDDMLNGVAGVMNLAAASGESLASTSDIVTDALTAFNLTAADSNHFADVLATAASNANTNVALMGETFKYVAPTAGALGYSIEDMATAIGLAGNAGIKGSQAGTSLNNILVRMSKPTNEVVGAMQRLGVWLDDGEGHMYTFREIMEQLRASFKDINMPMEEYTERVAELDTSFQKGEITEAQYCKQLDEITAQTFNAAGAEKARAAAQLAGQRGMTSLLAIVGASEEDWNKLTTAIDGASDVMVKTADGEMMTMEEALSSGKEVIEEYNGAAESMAAVMQDNLSGQMTILKSQLQELAISFGDMLVPTLRDVVGIVQSAVDKLNSMDEGTRDVIIKVALFAAAIGPVLSVVGRLTSGIGSVISVGAKLAPTIATMATTAAGAIPAIAGFVAPFLPFIAIGAAVVAAGVLIYKNWDTIKEKAGQLKDAVTTKWNEIKTSVTSKANEIKTSVSTKWDEIKTATSEKWEAVKSKTSEVMSAMKQVSDQRLQEMKSAFEKNGGGIKGTMAAMWTGLTANFRTSFNAINTLTHGKLGEISNAFFNKFNELKSNALNWGRDIIQNLVNGINQMIDKVKNAATNVAKAIADRLHFSEPDEGPLSNFHTYMPDMMDMLSKGMLDNLGKVEMAANEVAGAIAGATSNSYNYGGFTIVVNGAEGQNVNELADIIEDRINSKIASQKAVWA